jgi:UDP-glucose 4-epimerase
MASTSRVLVTGGAGFIGSHTTLQLLAAGYDVVAVDTLRNASASSLRRVEDLSGRGVVFHQIDVRDRAVMSALMASERVSAVIHFAALKAVGESVDIPLDYYDTNVNGTICLLEAMRSAGVKRLVFSSSCSIYGSGSGRAAPLDETAPAGPTNPYARTKLICEQIISDACASDESLAMIALRYFNPIGAHPSGQLGEDPRGIPNNVMPYLMQVAVGRREKLSVFGDDYGTPDGTGVRDYIHVLDVADGHLRALEYAETTRGFEVVNLGTGVGSSVLDLVHMVRHVTGREIPYAIGPRRPGDVASLVADPSKARRLLGWSASRNLETMCRDAWAFQLANPNGYESATGSED